MKDLLRAIAGLILWAIAFSMLYGLHGLGCALGWDRQSVGPFTLFRLSLIATWIVAVAAAAGLCWFEWGKRGAVARLSLTIAGIGLAGTILIGTPVLFFPACVP